MEEEQKLQQTATPSPDLQVADLNLIPKDEDLSPRSMNKPETKEAMASQLLPSIDILGAVKVRDGLFLGDEFASQDLEFVIANKVTHIINCAGRQIFNQWTPVGVKYLTFYWLDDDRQLIFDDHDQVAKEIYDFIEEANSESSGVLVHSVRGQSRACCVLSIYLMMKFRWTLLKSLEFINSRRPNLEIRASFLQQLSAWERRTRDMYPKRTDRWDELHDDNNHEERLLRNTFMNAQMQPVNFLQQWKEDVLTSIQSSRIRQKIKWADNEDEALKKLLARENSDEDLINKSETQIEKVHNHKREFSGKSLLKKKPSDIQQQAQQTSIHIQPKPQEQSKDQTLKQESKQSDTQKQQEQEYSRQSDTDKKTKRRPVTPMLKQTETSDLVSSSPRNYTNILGQDQKPKRSSSSRKIDKDREDSQKRDQYKARVAWNSPKEKDKQRGTPSPNKVASGVLKKELLEKAKKALAENAKVAVGSALDIKKIQDTLNREGSKIQHTSNKQVYIVNNGNQHGIQKLSELKNIIQDRPDILLTKPQDRSLILEQQSKLGNNIQQTKDQNLLFLPINNFFIQNASVIELPQDKVNTTSNAPIGQHHHKRTNSSSLQMAQQIKHNLSQSLSVQGSHRKNQLSEQILNNQAAVPFIMQQQPKPYPNNLTSKKDFKSMIKDMQRDSYSQLVNSTNFWFQQQKKAQPLFPNNQSMQDKRRQLIDALRPVNSNSQKQFTYHQRSNSGNRQRKLKRSDQLKIGSQQIMATRRAQTPMPQSPTNQLMQKSTDQIKKINQQATQFQNPMLIKAQTKKRSKSPSISQYQQKLQAKTAYLLMNSTNGLTALKNHSGYVSPKKTDSKLH